VDGLEFDSSEAQVAPGSRLFVYSDGAFEIGLTDGSMWPFKDFLATLASPPAAANPMDALVSHVRAISGRDDFQDDFSMLELTFR
jgi:sigma-B regulation protein RsbU (phosphoserine phosphatase)